MTDNECCKWPKKYIFSAGFREDNTTDYVLKCRHCAWETHIVGAYPIAWETDDGNGDIMETISIIGENCWENGVKIK